MRKILLSLIALVCVFGFVVSSTETETITDKLEFDEFEPGFVDADFYGDYWQIFWPTNNPQSKVIEEGGKRIFELAEYSQFACVESIMDPYTFSAKLKGTSTSDRLGLFVRASEEYFLIRNKSGQGEYFEADNADTAGIGSTGICIYPFAGETSIRLFVKAYDEEAKNYIKNYTVDIDVSEAYGDKTILTDYAVFRFEDNGSDVKLYVNDKFVMTAEFSEETNFYPDFLMNNQSPSEAEYYSAVTIKNASGEEILKAEDTLVCAEYSRMGVGARNIKKAYLEYLELVYEAEIKKTPEPTEKPEETEKPNDNPSTSSPVQTKAPDKKQDENNDKDSSTLIITIAVSVTIAAVIATAIVVVLKKKKG
jgi:hypothetical protein